MRSSPLALSMVYTAVISKLSIHLKDAAAAAGGESIIITFHPHPRKVVSSAVTGIRLINTLSERIELIEKAGA